MLIISAETKATSADCKRRAQWESAARAGQSARMTYTLAGWRQTAGGELWLANMLVLIDDDNMGVDGVFLISSVRYRHDAQGTRAELEIAPLAAYELGDLDKRGTKARAGIKSWG